MENELTNENYYTKEQEANYLTYSQFKKFLECESQALAIIEGRYEQEQTKGLLQGSYVDSHFSGEMEQFKEEHPEIFKKDGSLKADYEVCENCIKAIEADETFNDLFYKGEQQVILTGEIAGVPFKGKIDMLYADEDKIVDNKCMASIDDIWSPSEHRYVPLWYYYGYDIQQAIYQELYYQKTGKKANCFLSVVTKSENPQKHAFLFSQNVLDKALELVKAKAPRYHAIKKHEIEPDECGKCAYYHATHKFDVFDIHCIEEEREWK